MAKTGDEPYKWDGRYRMVAVRIGSSEDSKRVRIHLADSFGAPICGTGDEVVDDRVATGWPDCGECLKHSTAAV